MSKLIKLLENARNEYVKMADNAKPASELSGRRAATLSRESHIERVNTISEAIDMVKSSPEIETYPKFQNYVKFQVHTESNGLIAARSILEK
jgi:hypothetical protein